MREGTTNETRVRVRVENMPWMGVRSVRPSIVWACPAKFPRTETRAYLAGRFPTDGAATAVQVGNARVVVQPRPNPEPGERVLLLLINHDLLSLFAATVEPAGGAP